METIPKGIFPVNKPPGKTSFSLIRMLRKITGIRKIGHAGTLDPFAEGVMIFLIGREYTKQAGTFILQDKEYEAVLYLGITTSTYDPEGEITSQNSEVPKLEQIEASLTHFQGTIQQTPPMFSAKKVGGKRLYELARKGIEIPRQPITISVKTQLINYEYPWLTLRISCSKGTYIRTLAHDLGQRLGCGAYIKKLTRIRCGPYTLQDCFDGSQLYRIQVGTS